MQGAFRFIHGEDLQHSFRVAIVTSRFNEEITKPLLAGALQRLQELGVPEEQVTVAWVPGAVEIPLLAQQFAANSEIDVIIALGAVIRGDTGHYDFVCQQVSEGCLRVGLDYQKPVIFGILTTENVAQAKERAGGKKGHKGREAVDAAYEMVSMLEQVRQLTK